MRTVLPALGIAAVAAATLTVPNMGTAGADVPGPQAHGIEVRDAELNEAQAGASLASLNIDDAASRRPNVLVFTADDMAIGDLAHMPQTRRLIANQGTDFTQAIAPTPICVPARASLLTGQYAHNHGALTISGAGGGFKAFDDQDTLPVWLRKAGYDTSLVGKYLNGYEQHPHYRPPGWSDWRGSNRRTYSFRHVGYNVNGRMFAPKRAYSTSTISNLSHSWLSRKARKHKPWFAWVNVVGPHVGGPKEKDDPQVRWPRKKNVHLPTTTPARADRNRFRKVGIPYSPELWKASKGTAFSEPKRGPIYKRAMREVYQQRIESLQSVDRAVGRSIRQLRKSGQLRRTYIIFTSDNGYLTGHHNREGKLVSFNRSLRIPFIMRGPGVPRGKSVHTTVTNPDIGATIADIAHATPGRDMDGRSVMPYLRGKTVRRVIPLEAYPVRGGRERVYEGIRYGSWTYVRTHKQEDLYNRANDPGELHDLVGRAGAKSMLVKMRRWNDLYKDCSGADCRAATR